MKTDSINVLLVEDSADDAALVQRALAFAHSSNFHVNWVGSLSAALERVEAEPFDVALVDMSLPDSFGMNVVLRIRRKKPHLPVVLLTGNASDQMANDALERGAQDYLVKDWLLGAAHADMLERAIRYAIHRQKSQETQRLLRKLETSHRLLKNKNRRLATLCKTAERFVDNVSHEFRTPLTVIKEYTSMLGSELLGSVNGEQRQFLGIIENRADDLNRMVDDMLDVSKLDNGLLVMAREEASVPSIVEQALQVLLPKAASRNITVTRRIGPDLPPVWCDAEKVGRIIINLAVNAIKFCGEPGHVELSAEYDEPGKQVVMGVKDDGRGIAAEHLETIFERFTQVGATTRHSTQGFGLGLSIAKELVDLNFGKLSVASQVGKGSFFSFTLPVSEPLEVMRRYMTRLSALHRGVFNVALASVTIPGDTNPEVAADMGAFLNHVLRADDLVFRAEPNRWILVLAAAAAGVRRFCTRAAAELATVNRNRPEGALPELAIEREGSWEVLGTMDEPLNQFAALMAQPELCGASA